MQLYLFSDGLQPARYLVDVHGLRPAKVFFRGEHLLEDVVYTEKSDGTVLLYVLQGCTTTRPADAVVQLNKLKQLDTLADIVVYTNIPLYGCTLPYILYSGDIFSGVEADITAQTEIMVDVQVQKLTKRTDTRLMQLFADKRLRANRCDVVSIPFNIHLADEMQEINSNSDVISSLKKVDIFAHPTH